MTKKNCIKFMAVGDICLGDHPISVGFGLCSKIKNMSPEFPFINVASTLADSDIAFGNLECVLSQIGAKKSLKTLQMRGYPRFIKSILSSSFTILNLANNHTMQHGKEPFLETIKLLENNDIRYCGVNVENRKFGTLTVIEKHGLKVGFLGYSLRPRQYFNYDPLYCEGAPNSIIEDIKKFKQKVTVLVVSLHWGEEFIERPSPIEIGWARAMIGAGAKIIIGHHPHVIRGIENYKDGIILYSLGNFVGDMVWEERLRESLIFTCHIHRDKISSVELKPVYINDNFQPKIMDTLTGNMFLSKINRLSEEIHKEDLSDLENKRKTYMHEAWKECQIHRRESYRHFLKNIFRYPPSILCEQISEAVRRRIF